MSRTAQGTFFIWPTLAVVNAVNILTFVTGWVILGGSALGLSSSSLLTGSVVPTFEVPSAVGHGAWLYSYYHTIFSIIFLPLGIAGTIMTWVNYKWPVRRLSPRIAGVPLSSPDPGLEIGRQPVDYLLLGLGAVGLFLSAIPGLVYLSVALLMLLISRVARR